MHNAQIVTIEHDIYMCYLKTIEDFKILFIFLKEKLRQVSAVHGEYWNAKFKNKESYWI